MSGQLPTCALVVAFFAALTAATVPPVCPPGSHRSPGSGEEGESCLTCQPCPPGSYMEEPNRYTKCKWHRGCGKDEDVMVRGTDTSDVVCRCRIGGRRYHSVHDEDFGYDCQPCPDGSVTMNVSEGMDRGDTACCPPDSQAFRTRDGYVQCRGPGENGVTPPPSSPRPPVTSSSLPCSPADEDSRLWKILFSAAFTTLVIVLVAAIVYIVILKRQQRTRRMSSSEDEEKFSIDSNT